MIHLILEAVHGSSKHAGYEVKYSSLSMILLSALLWTCYYRIVKRFLKGRSDEFCCRLITLTHGLIITFIGLNICIGADECPVTHPDQKTTDRELLMMVTSLGYFVLDLTWCLYHQTETKLMLTHHAYSIIALYYVLNKTVGGSQVACAMGAMECTNPLLQCRWFLRTLGYHNTAAFVSVEVMFICFFVFIRILLGTVGLAILFIDPKVEWQFRLSATVIYVMSWMFSINMWNYMCSKYIKKTIVARQDDSD